MQVQLPECAARGLRGHTQAGRLREGQRGRLLDDAVGGRYQLGGKCPAGVGLTGSTSQGTQHGIAHGEVGDVRADGINDACEVAGHAPGEANGCVLQPASRMNDVLNPFKPSQVAPEGLEVEGIEPDGAHRDAYLCVTGCLRRALGLLQDLWSAESAVLDRSTHGSLPGLARRRDAALISNHYVERIV